MLSAESESISEHIIEPDKPIILPMKGLIEADKSETITVKYLPGSPRKFSKTFQLQISHFAPEEITIHGDAGFADIVLDIPRFENDSYKSLRKEAKELMKNIEHKSDHDIDVRSFKFKIKNKIKIKSFSLSL